MLNILLLQAIVRELDELPCAFHGEANNLTRFLHRARKSKKKHVAKTVTL